MKNSFSLSLIGHSSMAFAALALWATPHARAVVTIDPSNDLLSTYTGPASSPDLDVLIANVVFDGSSFTLSATLNGTIGTTPGGIYVFGLDRGTNNAPFGTFASEVLFDAVVTARPDTTATVTDIGGSTFQLPAGSVLINGKSLSVSVPASDLPSEGFAQSAYQYNLWPRDGTGNNNQIADFAPDNSDSAVTVVPEPGTTTLLGLAAVMTVGWLWRRHATKSFGGAQSPVVQAVS